MGCGIKDLFTLVCNDLITDSRLPFVSNVIIQNIVHYINIQTVPKDNKDPFYRLKNMR